MLRTYSGIVFTELTMRGIDKGMGFYVRSKPERAELRALAVYILDIISNAYGSSSLSYGGSFLRVAHRAPKAP